ncbi:hypothetical protein ACEWY4_001331 [Coilia grayii]|uniref:Uncharacterized protein n=1 Tax=Coilia grayii TaxID=363190 RepID=A0ABD1KSL7_9TELE
MKVMIDLFRGVLPTFQRFAKKLQHEKPMVHLVHVEMVALVRELLGKFMRPNTIPLSHKEILKVDVRRVDLQLPNKRLSVGQFCYITMNKACVEGKVWVNHIYDSLREGYMRDVRYPTLSKLVKALLPIFTGPLVEGSFNLMDDILEDDRCSMNVETYESLAVVKSTLKARDQTASTMTIDQPLRRACLISYQNYQLHLQKKKETEQALKQKRLSEAARMQSSKEANKLLQQAQKMKRPPKPSSLPISTPSAQTTTSSGQQVLKKKEPPRPSSLLVSTSFAQATTSSGQQVRTPDKPSSSPVTTSGQDRCSPFATASSSLDSQHLFAPASLTSAPATTSSELATTSSASATTSSAPTCFFPLFYGQSKASSAPNLLKSKGSANTKSCPKRKK